MPAESRQNNRKGLPAGRQGQLLVEAIIAISVMVIGLLGIFSLMSQSLGLYRIAYEEYVAANLAAEGVEVVKSLIDTNIITGGIPWNFILAAPGDFGLQYDTTILDRALADKNLLYDEATGIYNYTTGTATGFKRTVTITNVSVDEIQVNSTVAWKGRGGIDLSVTLEDHFFNWR